jgi:hypothetical protein
MVSFVIREVCGFGYVGVNGVGTFACRGAMLTQPVAYTYGDLPAPLAVLDGGIAAAQASARHL